MLRSSPPLTLRDTDQGLYVVSSAAGPIGGDSLGLDVDVAAGASITVRTIAAQLALPGPDGQGSSMTVAASVGEGARLRWLPEPMVLVRGADHRSEARLDLARDADVVWRDEVVLGRTDEPTGSLLQRLKVDRGGRPLLRHNLTVGPRWPDADGPVTAATRILSTVLLVGAPAEEHLAAGAADRWAADAAQCGVRAAACALGPQAVLLLVVGERVEPARALLAPIGEPSPPSSSGDHVGAVVAGRTVGER